ncbi:MAG: YggT family protein [Gammaproteobacteria bacterium]|nr:YggT family protein [Sideroxydans sp.]MBU3903016.1 YggT family protein [Gammaproteobacteria bacterium]
MLSEALLFLVDALVQPFAAVLLFRFHAVWLRVPMRNPLGEFVLAITDFIVLPLRRRLPSIAGMDSATLLLAFIFEFIYLVIFIGLQSYPLDPFPLIDLLLWTLVKLLKLSLYLLMASLLLEAVMSWVNPHTPLAPLLSAVNQPFVQPLRRRIPSVGGLDMSILVLLLLCQLLLFVLVGRLEQATRLL